MYLVLSDLGGVLVSVRVIKKAIITETGYMVITNHADMIITNQVLKGSAISLYCGYIECTVDCSLRNLIRISALLGPWSVVVSYQAHKCQGWAR